MHDYVSLRRCQDGSRTNGMTLMMLRKVLLMELQIMMTENIKKKIGVKNRTTTKKKIMQGIARRRVHKTRLLQGDGF